MQPRIELRFHEGAGTRWTGKRVREIDYDEAQSLFDMLPKEKRLATLSPKYVCIDALRDNSLTPTFILFEDDASHEFWLHSVHKSVVPNSDYCDYQSAYGYGGPLALEIPVLGKDSEIYDLAGFKYSQWCNSHKIIAEFVRLHPLLEQPYRGEKTLNRQTCVIPLGAKPSDSCRNKINKAGRAGVRILEVNRNLINEFGQFYRDGLSSLNAEKFYYFNDAYFKAMSEWDKAHLIIAERDGEWLAASIFLEGGDTLEYHLCTVSENGKKCGAGNALIAGAINLAAKLKLKQVFLGGGKTTNESDPLFQFKNSFGGELRPFYIGTQIHNVQVYYSMLEQAMDVPAVSQKVLFWKS